MGVGASCKTLVDAQQAKLEVMCGEMQALRNSSAEAITELRFQFREVPSLQAPLTSQPADIQKLVDQQRARLEVLANEVKAAATTNADAVAEVRCELREAISRQREQHSLTIPRDAGLKET